MYHEIKGPFPASQVLTLSDHIKPGHPSFSNKRAKRLDVWKKSDELTGPGIYGVFCKGLLYYVGIYTGNKGKLFAGSAIDRWDMHLTFFSLRSPEVCFVASNMQKILKLDGEPAEEYARILRGRDLTEEQIATSGAPFIVSKGGSCTYNKALFATRNWDVFRPGNEEAMMEDVSFVYAKIRPEAGKFLEDASMEQRYWWAKYPWIQDRETRLVDELKPICNKVTNDFRSDVTVGMFIEAVNRELSAPLETFSLEAMADWKLKKKRKAILEDA